MKIKLLILLIIGMTKLSFSQDINMIIQINERLITGGIHKVYLNFENFDGTKERISADYYPGELILNSDIWEKINSELTKQIILTFEYRTFKKKKITPQITNFEIEMKKFHFEKRYLILNAYDFREKKYRKRYSCLTDKNSIAELNFPRGGILVRCK